MTTSYQCPVCGVKDLNFYIRCEHPACLDGRDYAARDAAAIRDTPQPLRLAPPSLKTIRAKGNLRLVVKND